ncbi:hypothetical protein FKP32DRAFT_1603365 [Trametes sanguinea]|nr:hypothetical protein FKP32DRAFT_1603365 [Trametes sanguinea]
MSRIPQTPIDISKNQIMNAPRAMIGFVPLGSLTLLELLSKPPQYLARRVPSLGEQTLLVCGLPAFQLKFTWPGYESYNMVEKVSLGSAKCNAQVAIAVAAAIESLFQKASRVQSRAVDKTFALGPGSPYTIQNVGLTGLRHVHGDIFVAELEVSD